MSERIVPRSPRETMCGWVHLPRFVDKIRLHLNGQLHSDYQNNFTRGFDDTWLKAAGLESETFIAVVKNSLTDGEVCEWVRQNVKRSDQEMQQFNDWLLNRGRDAEDLKLRLETRKQEAGFGGRADIQTFVDLIEADEGRL